MRHRSSRSLPLRLRPRPRRSGGYGAWLAVGCQVMPFARQVLECHCGGSLAARAGLRADAIMREVIDIGSLRLYSPKQDDSGKQ